MKLSDAHRSPPRRRPAAYSDPTAQTINRGGAAGAALAAAPAPPAGGSDRTADRTALAVALAPAGRPGNLIYPVNLLVWGWALAPVA
ncbi:MAG TPA: hypothetical protein VE664_02435 [Actinomycetes bacterium]|nr:hypothetical protein [Actinomycetes bacterium]